MNKFLNIFLTIKQSFNRFASMYLFCFLAALFASLEVSIGDKEFFISFIMDFSWMIPFCLLLQLGFENLFQNKCKHPKLWGTIVQVAPAFLSIPFYFLCKFFSDHSYFILVYFGTLIALILGSMYFMAHSLKEKNATNLFVSFVVSGIMALCVGGSLSLILLSIDKLIFDISYFVEIIESIWIFSGYVFFVGTFVSQATEDYEKVSVSKFSKILFHYTLLPLFAIYILVLYVYFLKSIFIHKMPDGQINPFVSTATCAYMVLYLTLAPYKNSVTKFFNKWGPVFLFPLVILQSIAFYIRVSNYGFTITRCTSLLYNIFACVILVLIFVQGFVKKDFKILKNIYLVLCGFVVLAVLPKINIIDAADFSMKKQIEKIYAAHGLFENGLIQPQNAESSFTSKEKNSIVSFHNNITEKNKISWYKNGFSDTYGFVNEYYQTEDKMYWFQVDDKNLIFDLTGYSKMKPILSTYVKKVGSNFKLEFADENILIPIETFSEFEKNSESKNSDSVMEIELKGGEKKFMVTYFSYYFGRESGTLKGYLLEK